MNEYILSITFARDLVEFVLKHQSVEVWKSMKSMFKDMHGDLPLCVDSIGKSVLNLMLLRMDLIYGCYNDLSNMNVCQEAEFGQLAIDSVPHYFPNGYTHYGFIAFCGMVIGVAVYFLHLDGKHLFRYVAGIVGNVLTAFVLSGEFRNEEGWDGLDDVCREFNAVARKLLNKFSEEDFKSRSRFVLKKEIDLAVFDG